MIINVPFCLRNQARKSNSPTKIFWLSAGRLPLTTAYWKLLVFWQKFQGVFLPSRWIVLDVLHKNYWRCTHDVHQNWHTHLLRRRHFQMHFHGWKHLYFDSNVTGICFLRFNLQKVSIGSDNGLATKPLLEPMLAKFNDAHLRHFE